MKYFVTDRERDGTCYHEFYKGRWDGKTFWKEDSISLHDNIMFQAKEFIAALVVCVPKYDPFGETEITADDLQKIIFQKRYTKKQINGQKKFLKAMAVSRY